MCKYPRNRVSLHRNTKEMFSHYEEIAKSMGYYVDKSGQAYSPRGNKVGTRGKSNYLYFGIRINKSKVIKVYIHRLQAFQKFGDKIYEIGLEIRHLNNNCRDNSLHNIGVGTHTENMLDVPKEVRCYNSINAGNAAKRYSDEQAQEMYQKHLMGMSYKQIMKEYGISSLGTLSFIINKRIINIAAGCKGSISL